jgi:hypothetical protein
MSTIVDNINERPRAHCKVKGSPKVVISRTIALTRSLSPVFKNIAIDFSTNDKGIMTCIIKANNDVPNPLELDPQAVYEYIKTHPESTPYGIAKALGSIPYYADKAVEILYEQGKVTGRTATRRGTACYLISAKEQ